MKGGGLWLELAAGGGWDGNETGIASKGAKMASLPNVHSTAFEKVPLSAPSASKPPTPLQLAAYGARRNGVLVCRPSFVVLLHPVPD
jgi:hypothetical protein